MKGRQCHYCFKSERSHDVSMSQCAGCTRVYYCSKACQKAHWSNHKPECLAQRNMSAEALARITRIEAYAKAHRSTVFTASTQALYLHRDVTRCRRFFMRLVLDPVADATKADAYFTLVDATLLSMDHPRWLDVREQYDSLYQSFQRSDGVGGVGFFVALFIDRSTGGAVFLDPISFDQKGVDYLTDGWMWKHQLFGGLNHVPERSPDARKAASELMQTMDLSSFSFSRPHFSEQVLDPIACSNCGMLAKRFIPCPGCKHMHYCSLPCLLLAASVHSGICVSTPDLPESDRQSSADLAKFVSAGRNVEMFEAVALNAYDVKLGPAKSETHLLVIQLRRRQARHLEHGFLVERADTIAFRRIPNGTALKDMFARHHAWSLEMRPDLMSTVADGWKVATLSILFVDAETKAFVMHSVPFWPRTVSGACDWPFDWRHFLNARINGSREDEKLERSASTCPCAKCVRARGASR